MKNSEKHASKLQTEEQDSPFKDPNEPTIPDIPPNPLDPSPGHEPNPPNPYPVTDPISEPNP